jgi:hypothetical protein
MDDLNNLIMFENENTRLDFKLTEYIKPEFSAFLKDIISMANANTNESRYIIIGLKPKSNGDRGIIGIEKELTDPSTYQQLINENIEPELQVEYYPYKFEDKILGVIKISNCNNQPYLFKKDYGDIKNKLHKGDGFIRKGSHQTRILRVDLDNFYNAKMNSGYFTEEILLGFKGTNYSDTLELKPLDNLKYPSEIQKAKITNILNQKLKEKEKLEKFGIKNDFFNIRDSLARSFVPFGGGIPYENRDIETLEKNLKNVSKTYRDEDYYYVFEKKSHKINLDLINLGTRYIEDATIQIYIKKDEGLLIADQIYQKPVEDNPLKYNLNFSNNIGYPRVEEEEDKYIITQGLRDIAHQLKIEVFSESLRVVIFPPMLNKTISLSIKLFGKNLAFPLEKSLKILIK